MIETCRRLWQFSRGQHKNLLTALILSFVRSLISITQFLAIILTLDVLTGGRDAREGLISVAILAAICVLGNFLTSYAEQIKTLETGFFMTADQRIATGSKLRTMPLGFFNQSSRGRLCASLTTTLSGLETAAAMVMVGIVSGLFNAFCLFLFMLFYDWRIGLLAGVGMAAYLLLVQYQMKLSRRHAPDLQAAQTELSDAALTFLQGIKVTKAFRFREGSRRMENAIRGSRDANIRLTKVSMPSQTLAGVCVAVFESLLLLLSLFLSMQSSSLDIAKTVILILFSFMVYASLRQAGSMLSMIGLLDTGLDEFAAIEQAEPLKQEEPEEHPVSSEIVFDHVCFSYGTREILHDISLTVKPHTLTALIGPSGSGKTTLCQLIPRFQDIQSGKITVGGADITHMSHADLMSRISMVFQHVYLFEDTVENNIRFGKPDASEEEVREAARKAGCDEFIRKLPDGYQTILREGGSSLSGGEKQRISIARAILKDAPIIILDEATSALDPENEQAILDALDHLTAHKTVIMIAHRLETVRRADCILALKDGKIVERGTHEELCRKDGLYRDFLTAREEAAAWQLSAKD